MLSGIKYTEYLSPRQLFWRNLLSISFLADRFGKIYSVDNSLTLLNFDEKTGIKQNKLFNACLIICI